MSLSATDTNGSYSRATATGKTPPPAPSAAYAKRAREMQGDGGMAARYRPPALRALASGASPNEEGLPSLNTAAEGNTLPPSSYPPGFRRPRAGTLPTNVHLAATQRFGVSSNALGSGAASTESLIDQLSPAPASAAPLTRPVVRHAATTLGPSTSVSRLRSESLSNAFGSSIFSSWTPNSGGNGFSVLDELRSVTSADDEFDVHTLDYLGLADTHRSPPAATISELRHQAQATITGNLPARTRASTVSTFRARPSIPGSLLSTAPSAEEEEYLDTYDETSYGRQRLNSYDPTSVENGYPSPYVAKGFKPTDHLLNTRPRAISVGTLEDPMRTMQRRATTAADTQSYVNELQLPGMNANVTSPSGILRGEPKLQSLRSSTSVHFPGSEPPSSSRASAYMLPPGAPNRATSPKADNSTSQAQTPSRSLWIGNLDSNFNAEQLIHVFAPYGAIESLRLLPEKECGFVNFVDQADAIRAKDDVLNRLGGNIGMPNGQTVRIGFGKADSAPIAPAKGTPTSPRPNSPGGNAPKSANAGSGLASMEAQLQSTPTRALWIGSIPSSTTPATILSVFSPYGPIESARVLTHKNCGFINFERLDDAVRARKALNGRDVLGSEVGAIRIGFAKVPVKNSSEGNGTEEQASAPQGIGELSVGASIHALRTIKGASTIPADQQILGGAVENYRSNLLLSLIGSGTHSSAFSETATKTTGLTPLVTEQQMIMKELSAGSAEADADILALADFRPPTTYYTSIPLVSDRTHNRRWDAAKLRELRKKLDSGSMTIEEIDQVAGDFLDAEIVDLASDWLGNTVVQKLFEKCSPAPRFAMLERLAPSLAMIGIHKNGTWAAQKIIECVQTPEEVALIALNLRPYGPPLLLDQFGNYVVQCCLRFGAPANDFIFDGMVDRMWEVAQGRFGARSMRACLESPHITLSQQRRIATAIILNSIPLATNPNGALLLTWLLDSSGFPSRYNLLAPRFTPHLSHLCTHKLASLTVLRIVNQKVEPDASKQIVDALFCSPGDHVLTDVLGDQVNGVAVVHKILTSPFIDPVDKPGYLEATKHVLIELKVIATQAYRRLIEEIGLPIPNFATTFPTNIPTTGKKGVSQTTFGMPGLPTSYASNDQGLASMMAALQMGGQNPQAGPAQPPHVDPTYNNAPPIMRRSNSGTAFSPVTPVDVYNPFGSRPVEVNSPRSALRRTGSIPSNVPMVAPSPQYVTPSPSASPSGLVPMAQPSYGPISPQMTPQSLPPHLYQTYMYQTYPQNPQNMGSFHA